jgi:predicted Zn-dependent protease with MMP-like domain
VFDLRYHVASLVAVILMFVVGILVGAAISDPSLADRAEEQQLRDRISRLERELEAAQEQSEEDEAARDYVTASYDAVIDERLAGKRVGVLYVGRSDGSLGIEDAIEDAGGDVARMRVVDVPIDPDTVSAALRGTEAGADLADDEDLERLGEALANEFVRGGETPLWDSLEEELVQEQSGDFDDPVDAVVVARTERPGSTATGRFVVGLFEGVSAGVPAVGVESSQAAPSAVPAYRRGGLSIVDDVDRRLGKIALAVLLAGGEPGHYGVKDGSDAAVPPIEPLEPQPEPGG